MDQFTVDFAFVPDSEDIDLREIYDASRDTLWSSNENSFAGAILDAERIQSARFVMV